MFPFRLWPFRTALILGGDRPLAVEPKFWGPDLLRQHFRDRLLRLVRVLVVAIHLQFVDHLPAQLGLRQHTDDGVLDDRFRLVLNTVFVVFRAQATWETR